MSNRFEIKIGEFEEENIVDNLNGEIICEIFDMCKKMNKLHEQNKELQEENEELQKENKKLRDFEYFVFKSIGELNEKRGE